jgi:hypothetical protein
LRLGASPADLHQCPALARSAVPLSRACHSLPLRSLRRPRHPSALSLHPPTRRAATAPSAAASTSCHSPVSPSSPHRTLRLSSWYYPTVALAAIAGAHAISIDSSDIFHIYPMFFHTFPSSFITFFLRSSSSMYLLCNLLRK